MMQISWTKILHEICSLKNLFGHQSWFGPDLTRSAQYAGSVTGFHYTRSGQLVEPFRAKRRTPICTIDARLKNWHQACSTKVHAQSWSGAQACFVQEWWVGTIRPIQFVNYLVGWSIQLVNYLIQSYEQINSSLSFPRIQASIPSSRPTMETSDSTIVLELYWSHIT